MLGRYETRAANSKQKPAWENPFLWGHRLATFTVRSNRISLAFPERRVVRFRISRKSLRAPSSNINSLHFAAGPPRQEAIIPTRTAPCRCIRRVDHLLPTYEHCL